jgi:hypothetical protein
MELVQILKSVYSDVTNGGEGCWDVGLPFGYAHVDEHEDGIRVVVFNLVDEEVEEAESLSEISALMILDKYQIEPIEDVVTFQISRKEVEIMLEWKNIPVTENTVRSAMDYLNEYLGDAMLDEASNYLTYMRKTILEEGGISNGHENTVSC